MGPPPGNRGVVQSRSHNGRDQQEESVYNTVLSSQAAPKVRTYQAGPTTATGAPAPKARMHIDSSQVGCGIRIASALADAGAAASRVNSHGLARSVVHLQVRVSM